MKPKGDGHDVVSSNPPGYAIRKCAIADLDFAGVLGHVAIEIELAGSARASESGV